MTDQIYRAIRCTCGNPTCTDWHVEPVAQVKDVCFTEPQALAVADLLNRMAAPDEDGWEWAVVEIMGHRRHVARCREIDRFGAKLLRVDEPRNRELTEWETHLYPGAALFCYTPTTREEVVKEFGAIARLPPPAPYRSRLVDDGDPYEDADGDPYEDADGR